MARGGLSFAGIGAKNATFNAGAGIQALVAAADRDAVVGLPVVVTDAQTVDVGSENDSVFGIIDVYEMDGHCTVQFAGFREGVSVVDAGVTPGRLALFSDTATKLKDGVPGVGVKQSMTKTVTTKAATAGAVTVTITAAGSMALANGKDVTVTLDTTSVNSNATSIRGALGADEDVSAYFVVSGTGADVVLTRKVAAANEVMSFAFEDTGTTGAKMGATADIAGVADLTAGEYTFATDTVTFAVEDAGKLVYIAYDVATTNAQKMTLETSTNADVFRVIVTGEAILAENEGVTVLDQLTIDRAKVTGEVKMPDRSKEPKGWNFTLKLQAPRAGYKAVDYKYVM